MSVEFIERHSIPEPNSGCWLWTASILTTGYGLARFNGQQRGAHRASWEAHFGEIPKGQCVCHKCDVRSCVNPNHLFLGTYAENNSDMMKKGRHKTNPRAGESHADAKLTEDAVLEIRASRETHRALAQRFGVHHSQIGRVRRGSSWRRVSEGVPTDAPPRGKSPTAPTTG